MLKNYITVAVRILSRQKLYTFINVFGLSLGIGCCVLMLLFVRNEFSYDSFQEHAGSIFRVLQVEKKATNEVETSAYLPMPLGPALRAAYPEIERVTRFSAGGAIISRGDKSFSETILYTDPDAFLMFDITFLQGNRSAPLKQPSDILLTKEMAQKYFAEEDPVGKQLLVRTKQQEELFTVTGVVESMPGNSSLQFDFLANMTKKAKYQTLNDRWSWSNGSAFVLLAPGARPEDLQGKFPPFVQEHFGREITQRRSMGVLSQDADAFGLELQPLKDVHLDTRVGSSLEEKGNPTYAYLLAAIAVIVLTIACINFVTLSIGRSANRAKEVGMRKVLGAVRIQLIRQFWGEAILMATLAMVLGLAFAELFLPTFNQFVGKHLDLSLADMGFIGSLAGLLLVVAIAAGSYPALHLSRFEPVEVLKGRFRIGGKSLLTRALVVFQFGLSIFLICAAQVVSGQLHYMITSNLGFHVQQVAVLPIYADPSGAERITDRFRDRVREDPNIIDVSATSGAFTHGYDINSFQYNGEVKSTFVYRVDEHYLSTLGIPLEEGRNFIPGSADDRDRAMIVNEAFLRTMGWNRPAVGNDLAGTGDNDVGKLRVIGVVRDFHFRSLREEIRPTIMLMNPRWPLDDILIRIAPTQIPHTVAYLRQVWNEQRPNTPFDLTFMDEDFRRLYDNEMRWGEIVSYSSAFAVCLACFGLFGLATLTVTNRTKEIGIRKVLGATGPGVVRAVSTDFLKLVLFANVLSGPAVYLASSKFLENYVYRITLTPLVFVEAGLSTLVIAFLAIAGQVIKAARANPVEALRYE